MARNTLENGDKKFHDILEKNVQLFIDTIKDDLCDKNIKGFKWDDLVTLFEWKYETRESIDGEWEMSDQQKDLAKKMMSKFTCQFDK